MERKRATIIISLIPKVTKSESNLNSIYVNFLDKVKTFRTVAAERTDHQTQSNGSEGGGDIQQTTAGGFLNNKEFYDSSHFHNIRNYNRSFQHNPSGYDFQHNANVQKRPRSLYFHNRYNNLQNNRNGYHSQAQNMNPNSKQNRNGLEDMDCFCNEGNVKEAMRVLNLLYKQGVEIDLPRYCQLMKVIGEVAAKEEAKMIHNHLMKTKFSLGIDVQNKVLEMYLKCGLVSDACDLFENIPARNLTSWDTMIVGMAENGYGEDAIDLFTEFKEAGGRPNGQMFLGVLYACSILFDVNEGLLHFESMIKVFGIAPSMDHYVGVVKMLASAGYLDEAFEFIEDMPVEPSIDVWETLMNLCRIHGNLESGDVCANIIALLDPSRLNVESKAGFVPANPSDMQNKFSGETPLRSLNGVQQQFRTGDTSYADNDKIYAHLRTLSTHMKESGYIPELRYALHDVDDESKAAILLAHSEKLACVSGLLSSPARSQMRIIKNFRVCEDCHNALKIISKIVGRRITIFASKRFHQIEKGVCSCNDFY